MSQGTPCSSQLIWCETRVEKLEMQLAACKAERDEDAEAMFKAIAAASATQAREKVLRDALESVRQYGSDTLSGRIDGPDDRAWQRGAVLEMTRRARVTIDAPTDDTALRAVLRAERERCRLHDAADVATKAMRKAWQLGQTYWQQADSDSYKQNAKSAITQDSFNDLLDSTAEAIRALEDE